MLTVEKVMTSSTFADEGFDRPRWWNEGSWYTTLHRKTQAAVSTANLTETTYTAGNRTNSSVNEIILHNASTGESTTLVTANDLIPDCSNIPLSIDDYATSADRKKILIFTSAQKVWRLKTRGSYWLLNLNSDDPDKPRYLCQLGRTLPLNSLMFATFSPDASKVAYVCQHNIFVEHLDSAEIVQLTHDGSETIINGTFDWVYEEEFHLRNGIRWSPDGNSIAYWQLDQSQVPIVHLINNTDNLYPRLISIPYPKCGQTNPSARIGVIPAVGGDTKWIEIPGDTRNNYVADLDYIPATGELVIQHLNRLQNKVDVMIADVTTGRVRTFFTDSDDAWVDITHGLPWDKSGNFYFTLSERDGWRRAYRVSKSGDDAPTELPLAVTPSGYDAIEIVGCDDQNSLLYYIASPYDPLRRYLFVVNYDGSCNRRVTPDTGEFFGTNSYSLSKDCKYAVHSFSSANCPPVTSIVSLPNHEISTKLASNAALLAEFRSIDVSPISFFRVPITVDGATVELDAWCLLPPGLDQSRVAAYPVIFHVYGEPAAQIVRDQWGGRLAIWHRMLSQRGAVVICIDNRGTPCPRGREWRKSIYRKVGILAASDQASAVTEILSSRPYIDKTRVGVWGWSGGGSMSLNALFRYPDLYQSAVVVAPVPDMRLYDTIYQERYMGLPDENFAGYRDGSPITFASQMSDEANLLLIHGTGDDNCHYQGMELLINELIRYNKQFQMIAYPNRSHSISEGENTTRHLFESITRFWRTCGLII